MQQTQSLAFSISSHVVRQLGEELITEPEQAILELIKNAHDAEAFSCTISIDTNSREEISNKACFLGKITISDTGVGMTIDDIRESWLHISGSQKRQRRKLKETTQTGRNLTGEKGLGRLSSMRLGQYLKMTTYVAGKNEGYEIGIHWNDFQVGKSLTEISVDYKALSSDGRKKGTTIEILGLNQLEHWQSKKNIEVLSRKLYALVFPFSREFNNLHYNPDIENGDNQSKRPISLFLKYNENTIEKPDTAQDIDRIAVQKFDFKFEPDVADEFKLTTKAYLALKPFFEKEGLPVTDEIYESYFQSFKGLKGIGDWTLTLSKDRPFELEATTCKSWDDIASSLDNITNPGPFNTKIYSIDFNKQKLDGSIARDAVKSLTGVWAYKDGFRIGNDKNFDWLHLSDDKASGASFYSLRPSNIIGYIELDGYKNDQLTETSNREGFIDNAAYKGFWAITRDFVEKSNKILALYRRFILEFSREYREKEAGRPENYTAQHALSDLQNVALHVAGSFKDFEKSKEKIVSSINELNQFSDNKGQQFFIDPETNRKIQNINNKTKEVESYLRDISTNYDDFLRELRVSRVGVEKIKSHIENLSEQGNKILTQASIGVTAQRIAHDINSQLSDIYNSTRLIKTELSLQEVSKRSIMREVQSIDAHANSIAKEVSFLDPLLTSRLKKAEVFKIVEKLREFFKRKDDELTRKKVSIAISGNTSASIQFNPGKFFLVIDNLYQNSLYWLDHYNIKDRIITIEIQDDGFNFSDSGRGVRQGIDQDVFEMFITDKPDGQGLGLYIVNKILEERNCHIYLLDELNDFKRRFKFFIDLTGARVSE